MYYIFLFYSAVDGHISCFYFLAIVHRAATNMAEQYLCCKIKNIWMYDQAIVLIYTSELDGKTLLLRTPYTNMLKHGQIKQEASSLLSTFYGVVKCYVHCHRRKIIIGLTHLQTL